MLSCNEWTAFNQVFIILLAIYSYKCVGILSSKTVKERRFYIYDFIFFIFTIYVYPGHDDENAVIPFVTRVYVKLTTPRIDINFFFFLSVPVIVIIHLLGYTLKRTLNRYTITNLCDFQACSLWVYKSCGFICLCEKHNIAETIQLKTKTATCTNICNN